MNPGARPHEREAVDDLEAELGALGAMLRSAPLPEPPPACDAAIRTAAHDAARRKRHGGGRWSGVLAAAATVSLAVGIGWHAARDPQVTRAPGGGRSAASPAAPSPENSALQGDPAPTTRFMDAAETRAAPTPTAVPAPAPTTLAPVSVGPALAAAAVPAVGSAAATAPAAARAAEAGARPDPVAWLARIDALRRAGQDDEAAREQALLDATWPGWREGTAAGR